MTIWLNVQRDVKGHTPVELRGERGESCVANLANAALANVAKAALRGVGVSGTFPPSLRLAGTA